MRARSLFLHGVEYGLMNIQFPASGAHLGNRPIAQRPPSRPICPVAAGVRSPPSTVKPCYPQHAPVFPCRLAVPAARSRPSTMQPSRACSACPSSVPPSRPSVPPSHTYSTRPTAHTARPAGHAPERPHPSCRAGHAPAHSTDRTATPRRHALPPDRPHHYAVLATRPSPHPSCRAFARARPCTCTSST